jgi:HAD superfamily hydrolase (TIGR01509 family)
MQECKLNIILDPKILVIFDLDGVLVDTQGAETRVLEQLGESVGVRFAEGDAERLFCGKRLGECLDILARLADAPMPPDAVEIVRSGCRDILQSTLRAMPGVVDALEVIDVDKCVASNSPADLIRERLKATGLMDYFGDRIYSAYDIGSWKPDPDLFLWAAASCGRVADQCIVVEDSPVGVQAALAAGMTVLQYGHARPFRDDVTAFSQMSELPALLAQQNHFSYSL